MKKIFYLFILHIVISFSIKGQCDIRMNDIYTPNGSPVVTFLMCESSIEKRKSLDQYYAQHYPHAVQIKTYDNCSSTRKFNCHGYAWLRVEQNIDRWIGTGWPNDIVDPEKIYITDGSYTEVSQETYPGKVFWASGDHTPITTEQQGIFISKWNEWPLMKHSWNYSPFGSSNLKYYKKTPPSSGIPRVSLDPPAMTCLSFGSTRTFRAVNEFGQSLCNNPNIKEIEWKIFDYSSNPPSMIQNYTTANCNNLLKESLSMYIHSHYQPYVLEFVCRAKSNSGTWGEWGPGHAYMVRSNCSSPQNIFNAYFDQSSATAIVSLTEEYYIIKEAAQQARLFKERAQLGAFQHSSLRQNDKEDSYDIELWNTNQRISSFRTNEPTFQISMAGLPAGLYFVRVVKDGQTYTQKLIKK